MYSGCETGDIGLGGLGFRWVGAGGLGFKYIIEGIRKTKSFFLRYNLGAHVSAPGAPGYQIRFSSQAITR